MNKKDGELKQEHKVFAEEYVIDWNGKRAYTVAYPKTKGNVAAAAASRLLTNVNIKEYIEEIQKDISKLAGISALSTALELKKIAYSNLSKYKDNWMTLIQFDKLTDDEKAAISEVQVTKMSFEGGDKEIVKFKLHDKLKALEMLGKMFGFNAADKLQIEDVTITSDEERERRIYEIQQKLKGDK